MGEQICPGSHRMSDYQIASIIRHDSNIGLHSETIQYYMLDKLHAFDS